MKKVLFATTALIATAGMAAAEVKVSGYGRFGLDWNEANDVVAGRSDTNITSRFRLQFDASTETDGGVTVGGRIRAQAESRDGTPGTAAWSAPQFHVAYGGLRVNVGNIWGAIDSAPGLYLNTTSVGTGIDGMGFNSLAIGNSFAWDTFTSAGAGRNGIEAIYSAGGFTGHVSYSQSNGGTVAGSAQGLERTAIMLSYSFGDYFVTGAYQSEDNNTNTVTFNNGAVESQGDGLGFFAIGGDFGQFGATLSYGTTEEADAVTLAGEAEIGAASTIVGWVSSTDVDTNVVAGQTRTDGTAFGINYEYDLGGGVTFVAGYVNTAAATNENSLQAGLHFSF
ncbi:MULTISPECIES: porin [unclassified Leisingera]|uniref:porin n=1 Tax=unclassified Leisingera TaxID=2614906 RepID=UPI0002FFD9AB|nr:MULTISPECIES: porin [unclassified Leisingera]KIC22189.1 porin [Leisingera sp. ANG-S3]KIC32752.1 porin [Leisingera sp. ANG-S5]KIC53629.1 porin [Leisingera sp. ANG-S]KID08023.1 porin [Leisingera sp. ANG1]